MLTLRSFAEAKGFTVEQLTAYGVRQGPRGVEIPYFGTDGSEQPRVRLRTALAAKDGSLWSDGEADLVPYGLNRPIPWERGYVFIVEGESDAWTLWATGKPALGLPGATNVKCLKLEHVDGAENLYVVREPGTAGARFPHRVAERLYGLGYTGHIFAIEMDNAKDPHELWRRDPAAFEDHLRAAWHGRELIEPQAKKAEEAATDGVSSLASLLTKPRVKSREIVEGLLPAGGILLLAAKPKAGKSVLARNLALAVARGGVFLDRQCERGSVLYVRLDEDYGGFVDALQAMGVDAEAAQRFHLNDEWPPIEGRIAWLSQLVQRIRPILVVVDTWAKLTNVREIKSYSEVLRANEPLDRLAREYGIAQLWVHHAKTGDSTGGEAVLGGTALFSACDTLMNLQAYPDGLRAISTIQRRGEDMEETPIVMDRATQLLSIAPAKKRLRRGKIEERIIEVLTDAPEQTKEEILGAVDFRKTDVLEALALLIERNLVEGIGAGVRGAPILYSIKLRNGLDNKSELPCRLKGTANRVDTELEINDTGTGNSASSEQLFFSGTEPVPFGPYGSRVRALRASAPSRAHVRAQSSKLIANSLETSSLDTKSLDTKSLILDGGDSLELDRDSLELDRDSLELDRDSLELDSVSPNTNSLLLAGADQTTVGGGDASRASLEHEPGPSMGLERGSRARLKSPNAQGGAA